MKTKKVIVASAAFIGLLLSVTALAAWWPFSNKNDKPTGEVQEIAWDDLIPEGFVQPENPFMTMTQEEADKLMDGSDESNAEIARLEAEFNYAPTVSGLDGLRVKIPAYITPLEYDFQTSIKEFLLVPYVGACMHTPPPPANQVVFAESENAIQFEGMYEAVWATGVIRTETVQSVLAETGYRLEVEAIQPYTE